MGNTTEVSRLVVSNKDGIWLRYPVYETRKYNIETIIPSFGIHSNKKLINGAAVRR
jgi:hypothetical protein